MQLKARQKELQLFHVLPSSQNFRLISPYKKSNYGQFFSDSKDGKGSIIQDA